LPELEAKVGNMAQWLFEGSRGLDDRPVETNWVRKSLGREETFSKDILEMDALKSELTNIVGWVVDDLRSEDLRGRTITLKVRYDDFSRISRSKTLDSPTRDPMLIQTTAAGLLHATEAGRRRIRLLGVSISNLEAS
jgi:DNA polymerase-4